MPFVVLAQVCISQCINNVQFGLGWVVWCFMVRTLWVLFFFSPQMMVVLMPESKKLLEICGSCVSHGYVMLWFALIFGWRCVCTVAVVLNCLEFLGINKSNLISLFCSFLCAYYFSYYVGLRFILWLDFCFLL